MIAPWKAATIQEQSCAEMWRSWSGVGPATDSAGAGQIVDDRPHHQQAIITGGVP
jgi:hypothetical protein